ncbi:MAG TPA: hypothetical protein VFQ45_13170 [Longimicrobium sp.]|nr:hypothetical protein [Longimicrobium sp.]
MARGVAGKLVGLVVLVLLGAGLWFFRGLIPGPWQREKVLVVSEEAAVSADEKLARLREDGDTVRLSGVEFTSYLRFRMRDRFTHEIELPSVDFVQDRIRVTGRFPTDRLPADIGRARSFLPDTADVAVNGSLRTTQPGRAAVLVQSASFAKIPVPSKDFGRVLAAAGRREEPGLGEHEIAFPLPPGVGGARVEAGQLVLTPGAR